VLPSLRAPRAARGATHTASSYAIPMRINRCRRLKFPSGLFVSRSCERTARVESFQNRVQQALDRGREDQVHLIRDMTPRRDPAVHFRVGDQAWLQADECPIPGDKHFKFPWTGPFPIVADLQWPLRQPPWTCQSTGACCPQRSILISCARFAHVRQS
jgi:hypothetical protein